MHSSAFQNWRLAKWQPLGWLAVYVIVVFAGAALLAPCLYHIVQTISKSSGEFGGLAQQPFHRYVNRALIFLGAAGLWPLFRLTGLNSRRAVGLGRSADSMNRFVQGFLLGFGTLAVAATLPVAVGARAFDDRTLTETMGHVLSATATAMVVAFLEELLFRGALFGSLRQAMSWPAALIVSSGAYAMLHFFQRPPEPEPVRWFSGFIILGEMCRGFLEWKALVPGFLNLMLAGMILAAAYQRLGTLHFSIGLHAGWIFWLKSYGFMTDEIAGTSNWVWGSRKLIDGWTAFAVLLLVWLGVQVRWLGARHCSPATPRTL